MINDVTEQLLLARQEAEQRELLSLLQRVTRDRVGLTGFMEEASEIVEQTTSGALDFASQRRLVHTLKGNASMAGLPVVARLCHQAEDEMSEERGVQLTPALIELRERWRGLKLAFNGLVGERGPDVVEVNTRELDDICRDIMRGAPPAGLVRRLSTLRCEPVERPLERLGSHAKELSRRLCKGDPIIDVRAGGLWLDPRRWGPLWSELVHLVNNAVDHGFDDGEQREAAGKPTQPRLRLEAVVDMDAREFAIEIQDDGKGIDWEGVRRSAVGAGCQPRPTPT